MHTNTYTYRIIYMYILHTIFVTWKKRENKYARPTRCIAECVYHSHMLTNKICIDKINGRQTKTKTQRRLSVHVSVCVLIYKRERERATNSNFTFQITL